MSSYVAVDDSVQDDAVFNVYDEQGTPTEMLRLTKTKFFVRGVEVPIDENEARTVYEGFKTWLTVALELQGTTNGQQIN